ncbi:squalene--hopene cyclase [Nitrospira moscoviensis]|uniref:Squalene--hopene cyclase n=1 Tax=Nitrospira moscoviensis TaxID=42253 RepID=A0A0K2G895_NITMO|nr:squalene--hopene cyclase [Nitrospira moscoviensis]ALA57155.1 Squalene--hopene cyclase [Nitrospira moscoviensis]
MKLIKALFSRLSDSLLSNGAAKLSPAPDFSPTPPLRLVSDKPTMLPPLDAATTRRPPTHAVSQPDAIDDAIRRSQSWFLARQHPEGHWVAELEADTTLTSEYLMLRRFLDCVDPERERKAVQYLKAMQLPDGGWPIYYGGPAEISASVKAYFALKLSGVSADEPCMVRAKDRILAMGGVVQANVFTKIALALFDQYDWEGIPHMPVELMLLPKKFYFSIYAISYWSRAVLIPLLIVFAHQPVCRIPREQGIEELYPIPRQEIRYWRFPPFNKDQNWFTAHNFFVALDALLKIYDRMPLTILREKALHKAATWMLERLKGAGGLGAIYPAMANSIVALRCLGYDMDDPLIVKALREIEELEVYDSASVDGQRVPTLHLQPCFSPIWDTALLINALVEGGMPADHPALLKAGSYLMSRQTKTVGDWKISSPNAEPGGWYFQFENEFYPDVDDSAVVLMALSKLRMPEPALHREALQRGMQWVVAMQGSDGGWGAYDKDNNRIVFNYIPFADHKALLDPSTSDLTGRCLEMLAALGYDKSHPAVKPALAFLKREQEADGSWYGRWGVNYIYGTWSVLAGLRAIGEDLSAPYIRRAVTWLESKQNPDGGWGESCLSYADEAYSGKGESAPSQTAWALMALMSAGVTDSFCVARGVQYLLRHQLKDGSWEEVRHTGTGFPRVFYLRYHWYCQYFPLWALAMYRNLRSRGKMRADEVRQHVQGAGSYRFDR